MSAPLLLEAREVAVSYPRRGGLFRPPAAIPALKGASFQLDTGEALAVVGESGSGKSTLARAVLRLVPLAGGQVLLKGEDMAIMTPEELRARRRLLQMIFQDPLACLDPRMRIGESIAQPLRSFMPGLSRAEREARAVAMLEAVGLQSTQLGRYPHQFSGGQAQRIGIARALIAQPEVLICDEPISALDVSIRTQVLELLAQLRRERQLALLFIAHDLGAVRYLCERTLVLYRGEVMECGPTAALFAGARHPYTRALLAAALVADTRRARHRAPPVPPSLPQVPPDAAGCAYAARCPLAEARCLRERPLLRELGGVAVACHYAEAAPSRASVSSS